MTYREKKEVRENAAYEASHYFKLDPEAPENKEQMKELTWELTEWPENMTTEEKAEVVRWCWED